VNAVKNNFLGNGGTELNTTSNFYDLEYRHYDPILGRMNGVDPMSDKYSSLSPYNFSFNDPVTFSDVNGADPYDDWLSGQRALESWFNNTSMDPGGGGWGNTGYYDSMMGGYGVAGMGVNREFGQSMSFGLSPYSATYYNQMRSDAYSLTAGAYSARYGDTYINRGYWQSSDLTLSTNPLQFQTPLNSELGELTVRGIRDRWVDSWVKVGGKQQNNAGLYFTGTAPSSLYNGALRMYYEYSAASLKGLYTGADGVIDYAGGSDARYRLKSNVRGLTLEPQRGILNQLDPLKTTTKATPRFWKTNAGWNVAGKLSAAGGLFGLRVAGYRIANAENKLSETGKVASGFAGAWIGMQAVGPLAATAGAFSGPAAPFVTGGILLIGGAAGALGAEWMFDQF
jgi:RHS repeat-associated protein